MKWVNIEFWNWFEEECNPISIHDFSIKYKFIAKNIKKYQWTNQYWLEVNYDCFILLFSLIWENVIFLSSLSKKKLMDIDYTLALIDKITKDQVDKILNNLQL